MASHDRVKVLYVAGFGRSGSTLLGNALGGVEGFVSVGEVRQIWEYGFLQDKACGCGAPFSECEAWRPAVERAFSGPSGVDARCMIRLRESHVRTKHVPLMLTAPGRRITRRRLTPYLGNLDALYRAVRDATGARVVVDASKFPSYGAVLGMAPSVDLYVLHLVRDPRAVAYSWLRKRLHPDPENPEYMPRRGPTSSALRWAARNLAVEALWRRPRGIPNRYMMLRYEDFVAEPQRAISRVLKLLGEEAPALPGVPRSEREVWLGTNHNVWGNPGRFKTGTVEVRPDVEWTEIMSPRDRRLVTALTLPLLVRYGYPLFGAGRSGRS